MQIVHRISISSSPQIQRELGRMGIAVCDSGFVSFEIDESDMAWPALAEWIAERRPVDIVRTKFSSDELTSAAWLELVPDWHYGYPQPDEDGFGFREITYDAANYCERCGVGMRQKAPFQMKGEPNWGKRGILQLHWIFDEYFVKPDVWLNVFRPHGIDCRSVLNTKRAELKTVVQLVIDDEIDVVTDVLHSEEPNCSACGRTKYVPVTRGWFPELANQSSSAMAKTRQYFGSGAAAHKRVLVTQAVARALVAANVRGASLRPVREPSGKKS